MKHTMEVRFRHLPKDGSRPDSFEAVVTQGAEEAATYRVNRWYDDTFEVAIVYHGKWCGLRTEYFGDLHERLDAKQVRDLLVERLGESALEIPTYLRA